MAKDNVATNQKKTKKKRPLLWIGLILLAFALTVGLGLFAGGSIILARNLGILFLLGGSGVGLGSVVAKAITGRGASRKNKEQNNSRTEKRTLRENLQPIPAQDETRENSNLEVINGNTEDLRPDLGGSRKKR